jgi:hypothetical protein
MRFCVYCRVLKLLLTSLILPASVCGFDFLTGQASGMGGTILLSQSAASDLIALPSGSLRHDVWKVEMTFQRQYDLSEFDQASFALATRRGRITVAAGMSQFGQRDFFAERVGKLTAAAHFDSLTVGVSGSGMLIYFGGGYERLTAATVGVGASYRAGRWFGAVVADELTSPTPYKYGPATKPHLSFYGEFIGRGSISISGRIRFQKERPAQFGIGQKLFFTNGGALFWGLANKPWSFGGGVEVTRHRGKLSYAANYHPVLGFSHTVQLSFSSSGEKGVTGGEFD